MKRRAAGYTLAEMMIALTSASVLMVGLAGALLIASRSFEGNSRAVDRSRAAEALSELTADLRQATSFASRGATSATFTVPDRNNDLAEETITYAWTGLPAGELTYSINGGPATTILTDIQDFRLTYLSRFVKGATSALPALDANQWGERWRVDARRFGDETRHLLFASSSAKMWGTRATLSEPGVVMSISAYITMVKLGGKSDVAFAIYSTDANGKPQNLITATPVYAVTTSGWLTLETDQTPLTPGAYILAVSYKKGDIAHHHSLLSGNSFSKNTDAANNGWPSSWGSPASSPNYSISIYATYTPN